MGGLSMPSRSNRPVLLFFDDWFVPCAFGVFTVLVGVQLITHLPGIQPMVDRMEGRFASVPVSTTPPSQVKSDEAVVTLTAQSSGSLSGLEVRLNGQSLGRFTTNQMNITVREGEQIQLIDHNGSTVSVSVDTDSGLLLLPAPGQIVELSANQPVGELSPAEFM
jgi:hypothetical protein